MKNKNYNVIDIFSGCGGLSLGFESADFNILLGIDNNKAALETFKNNHKNSKIILEDVVDIDEKKIFNAIGNKKIDVIVGGPPCQGMSISGPRKLNDPRNKLYLSFINIVKKIQPGAIIIENVPGLVSLYKGEIKDAIIKKLSSPPFNYNITLKTLRASEYGIPQHRKRVFIVGTKKNTFSFPEPTHGELEECKNNSKLPMVTCHEALSDLPYLKNELGSEIQKYRCAPQNSYQKKIRNKSDSIKNHIAAKHSEKIKNIISMVPAGCNYKSLPKKYWNTRNFNIAWTRFPKNEPSPTIDTGHRHHFHYSQNRVPTVRECARLQSFPDCFIFHGNKTEQFRQVGNAVPPLLAAALANKLKECL